MMKRFTLVSILSLMGSLSYAQQIDQTYNQKIREYTTDPRFLPASVLNLPDDPRIPSPRKFFGDIIGTPGIIHRTKEIYSYYQKLAQSSSLITVEQVGTAEEGRPIQLVTIASAETRKRLAHYKNQLALLADPRKIPSGDVSKIIKDSKPVYYLNGGLHAPEMGSPEMLMELAYRLITSQDESVKAIRDNLIILINPVSEPDGWDKQADWYHRYTKARKDYEDGFPRVPYWGRYAYHDNNRDGIQVTQQSTIATFKNYFEWHPTIMHDLHESVPLLYISTGTGPYGESVDPITYGEWQVLANHDITSMTAQGLPGVFTWAFFDGWHPGYSIWVANNHNSIGRFYETFGNAGANTYVRDLADQKYAGDPAISKEWYRPLGITEKINWSFRNNINYMQAAVLASLSYAASNGQLLLTNFYQKGLNNIKKGQEETIKAFVVPAKQNDPAMAAYLVNQLRKQGIEVHMVNSGANQGDYVIKLDQPYRNLAVTLLTKQNFPKEAKYPPYDDIAWTLGYLYGLDIKPQETAATGDLKLLTEDVKYTGKISGTGAGYLLNYKAQNNVLPALYWLKQQNPQAVVKVLDEKTITGNDTLAAGSMVFNGLSADQARQLTSQFGLDLLTASAAPSGKQHEVSLPKVAIYHSWMDTQDESWSRYTFEQRGIPYTSISKDVLKEGDLRKKFDVILIPRMRGTSVDFIHEIDPKFGPLPYTRTAEFPSHGAPDATDDMTGGPGFAGVDQLKRFVEEGGVVITLDNASSIIAGTGITRGLEVVPNTTGLSHPGSVVMVKARSTTSPVLYGFPVTFPILKGNGSLLKVRKQDRDMMLLQYGTKPLKDEVEYKGPIMGLPDRKAEPEKKVAPTKDEPYVLSGLVKGEELIIGHGTIFNIPLGQGRVVAFTFDPLHRFLNHHDAPLVWNTLINWNNLK
ncbi:MAG: M14 family zinc carboxypeptidase [Siphonobacter sp.]